MLMDFEMKSLDLLACPSGPTIQTVSMKKKPSLPGIWEKKTTWTIREETKHLKRNRFQ